MANITRKPNGTFLIRVSNGMKNGKQDLVSTIYKPPVGSTSAMARKAAEKYAVLFEELVHSGGYEKKQAVSREIRARRRMTIEQCRIIIIPPSRSISLPRPVEPMN